MVYNSFTMFTIDSTYQLKRRGLLSRDDCQILYSLYLPLIGYKGLFIYSFLANEYLISNKDGKISYLLNKSDMTVSDFLLNKKSLESIGLIQTLEKDDNYVFILKSCLNPGDFFNDPVLKGLFVNKVGENEAIKVMKMYEIDDIDFSKYTDISAGVKDSFSIDFDAKDVSLNNDAKLVTVNRNVIKDNFDDIKLVEIVTSKSNITSKDLTIEEIGEIHRLGTLYGLDEKIMSNILIDGFTSSSPDGCKIDLDFCNMRCKKEISKFKVFTRKYDSSFVHSSTPFAEKINYYGSTSPRDFLKDKQGGAEPIKSDLDIVQYLSENMGLNNGIINVILEYTLLKCDNKTNRVFIEKIASTIKRKKFKDSIQVYDYLFPKENSNKTVAKNTKNIDNVRREVVEKDIVDLDEKIEKLL